MTTSPASSSAVDADVAPDSQFESYFDTDSGVWSLRRIPTRPPEARADEPEDEQAAG